MIFALVFSVLAVFVWENWDNQKLWDFFSPDGEEDEEEDEEE